MGLTRGRSAVSQEMAGHLVKAQDLLLPPGGGGGAGASPAELWLPAGTAVHPEDTRDDLSLSPGGGGGAGASPAEPWLPPGTAVHPEDTRDGLLLPLGGGGADLRPLSRGSRPVGGKPIRPVALRAAGDVVGNTTRPVDALSESTAWMYPAVMQGSPAEVAARLRMRAAIPCVVREDPMQEETRMGAKSANLKAAPPLNLGDQACGGGALSVRSRAPSVQIERGTDGKSSEGRHLLAKPGGPGMRRGSPGRDLCWLSGAGGARGRAS